MAKQTAVAAHACKHLTFTHRTVLSVPAPDSGRIWCRCLTGSVGFSLMVTADEARTYYVRYKPRNGGGARTYKIGPARELSFREARDKAEETTRNLTGDATRAE